MNDLLNVPGPSLSSVLHVPQQKNRTLLTQLQKLLPKEAWTAFLTSKKLKGHSLNAKPSGGKYVE